MADSTESLPLGYLADVVRARWWLPAAAALVAAVAGLASAEMRTANYRSRADVTLLIHPLIWHADLSLYKPVDPGAMDHELLLVTGVEAQRAVAKRLGVSPATVQAAVSAAPTGGQSLEITASSSNRALVPRLLLAVLAEYRLSRRAELAHALSVREATLQTTPAPNASARAAVSHALGVLSQLRRVLPSGVRVTHGPTAVRNANSPNPAAAAGLGAILGALVGIAAIVLLDAVQGATRPGRRQTTG
jgi:hypothetical protein